MKRVNSINKTYLLLQINPFHQILWYQRASTLSDKMCNVLQNVRGCLASSYIVSNIPQKLSNSHIIQHTFCSTFMCVLVSLIFWKTYFKTRKQLWYHYFHSAKWRHLCLHFITHFIRKSFLKIFIDLNSKHYVNLK